MTFDDDFILAGSIRTSLKSLGMEWPPPPFICVNNHGAMPDLYLRRVSMSEITDEQRAEMTHVARGAKYVACSPADLPQKEEGHG